MESKLINWILPEKEDVLYKATMNALNSVASFISLKNESGKDVQVDKEMFHKIFPNDPASPSIYWIDRDQYMIYYPPFSKPYSHKFETKCKFIECLSGKVYDKNSNKKLFKGDQIKVTPQDNYEPYTTDEPCYLRVCVGSCDSVINQICK